MRSFIRPSARKEIRVKAKNEVVYFEKQYVQVVSYDACPELYDAMANHFVPSIEDNLFKEWILNQFSGLKRELITLLFDDHNIHTAARTLRISNSKAYKIRDELRNELPRILQR